MTFRLLYLSHYWRKFFFNLGKVDVRPYWRSDVEGHR